MQVWVICGLLLSYRGALGIYKNKKLYARRSLLEAAKTKATSDKRKAKNYKLQAIELNR